MTNPPVGWPRLSSVLFYDHAEEAIAWLQRAFGFELQLDVRAEDGSVAHSQLVYGEALIMVCEGGPARPLKLGVPCRSPLHTDGANTQNLMLYVGDVDSHCSRARKAGATIIAEPTLHDYGPDYWADRSYGAKDLDGHLWWFTQRVRNPQTSR